MKVYSIIKMIEFSIPLCALYWDELKFLGNLVGFNYMNGFGNIEKLKKYGIGWCGDAIGFSVIGMEAN